MQELGVWSLSACALAWLVGAPAVPLSGQLLGPEFQVNSYTTGHQTTPAVAMDGAGNFVVVWQSVNQDLTDRDITVQRFDAAGSPAGGEFQANSFTTLEQWFPSVAMTPAGEFLVVWNGIGAGDFDTGVFARPYDAAGNSAGNEFRVNSYTTGFQWTGGVVADGQGNFVVIWNSEGQDGSGYGVFGRRFNSAGSPLGGEFQVNSYTTGDQQGTVAADAAGNFLVVWKRWSLDFKQSGVRARRYNAAGVAQGDEFQVTADSTDSLGLSSIAAAGDGSFVVVWYRPEGDHFAQRLDAFGAPVGEMIRVNSPSGQPRGASVATGAAGSFVVVWHTFLGLDGSYSGAFARQFDGAGNPTTNEFQVNSYSTGHQVDARVAGDGAGSFVVSWISDGQDGSGHGIFGQRLQPLLFADGFEGESVCGWSEAAGSGDLCP